MTKPNDPAAPCKVLEESENPYIGEYLKRLPRLTKRELFAKDFMAAIISNAHRKPNISDEELAEISISRADALIKKLNETKG